MAARKLLLVGWDAADWKIIHPLMDSGRMPHLQRLVHGGVMANIATLHPVLSPMLWTSIATGKRPFDHGILGFVEPTPDGLHVRPVTNQGRRTKAIWNILNQNRRRCNVVGWWPSHPAEPIDGVMVSDQFAKVPSRYVSPEKWTLSSAAVHPPRLLDTVRELRMHPNEMTPELLLNFIPEAHRLDQQRDPRLSMFTKIFCECTSLHAVATHVMEQEPWDFMAIYYDAIDHFSHGFMKYHPPRLPRVSEKDFEIFQHVITSAYIYHDMMLGRLLELAGPETTVIVMSDHGFHSDHLRPKQIPAEPAGPAYEHRDHGMFVMHGPGIVADQVIYGMSLLDVAPTILHAFDLPVGEDLAGRVRLECFADRSPPRTIPSWDPVGPPPEVCPTGQEITVEGDEAQRGLQQLVELGYIEAMDENREQAVQKALNELKFNRSRSLMDAGRFAEALPDLLDLFQNHPSQYRYGIQLALCFKALQRFDDLEKVVSLLTDRRRWDATNAVTKLQKYRALMQQRREAWRGNQASKSTAGSAEVNTPTLVDLFQPEEIKELNELRSRTVVHEFALDFLAGYVNLGRRRYHEALRLLKRAIRQGGPRPSFLGLVGEACLALKDFEAATSAFQQGLELDPDNATLTLGLAQVALKQKRWEEAAAWAHKALGQRFHLPVAHYVVGIVAQRNKNWPAAQAAFRKAIELNPNFYRALRRWGYVERALGNTPAARNLWTQADRVREINADRKKQRETLVTEPKWDAVRELEIWSERAPAVTRPHTLLPILGDAVPPLPVAPSRNEEVIVVSGLPRSGTSMMMQILQAGGLTLFTDGQRLADEDNPKGYWELQDVKRLNTHNEFVREARGKVVKVVAPLLAYLPAELPYRVLFLERNIDEVWQSQRKMLARKNPTAISGDDEVLRGVLLRQFRDAQELLSRLQIPVMFVPYAAALANPSEAARRINRFFGGSLSEGAMREVVDQQLYRNRQTKSSSLPHSGAS